MLDAMEAPGWQFFDALSADQLQLPYVREKAFEAYGSTLSLNELSCAAGHIGILKSFVERSVADYVVVMEDDVQFDPSYRIQKACAFMRMVDVDYLKLFVRQYTPANFIANLGTYNVYRSTWPPLGAQCYVLSRRGAATLLKRLTETGSLNFPIDVAFDRYWETGLPVVIVYPFSLIELAVPTTIHDPASRLGVHRLNDELRKSIGSRPTRAQRLGERIRKRWADYQLKQFDRALAARIEGQRQEISAVINS